MAAIALVVFSTLAASDDAQVAKDFDAVPARKESPKEKDFDAAPARRKSPKEMDFRPLVKQLASDSFREREDATQKLVKAGKPAIPAIIVAAYSMDPEVKNRAIGILRVMSKTDELAADGKAALQSVTTSPNAAAANRMFANFNDLDHTIARLKKIKSILTRDSKQRIFRVHLRGNKVLGDSLPQLVNLPALTELNLEYTWKLKDQDLTHLAKVTQLESLLFSSVREMTDEGLRPVKMLPNLKHLCVHGGFISDAGMSHIGEMKDLESLRILVNGRVTGDGLKHVAALKDLKSLRLYQCSDVKDDGLKHVGELTKLQTLDLRKTPITDEGLAHLTKLKSLETLQLEGTKVTDEGVKTLRAALPRCKISTGQVGTAQ